MKYIVVDLEMNPIAKNHTAERFLSREEVIEIGAVVLDESFQEIGSFKTYVKPEFNTRIEKRIERLTKIRTEMVSEAPVFREALSMFLSWCSSIPGEVQMVQWSDSDLLQLLREISLKAYPLSEKEASYLEGWLDFQKECGEKLGLDRQISLSQAINYAGLDFDGRPHDALNDARNTGSLLHIVRDPELCRQALNSVISALQETPIGTSLGDLLKGLDLLPA